MRRPQRSQCGQLAELTQKAVPSQQGRPPERRRGRAPALSTLTFALELLKRIARGRKVSTTELCRQLREAGWDRDVRTVQRQLDELTRHFDIERDERSKPYGYRWKLHADGLSVSGLTEKESLVLALAQQHLRVLLPPTVMASMAPFFEQAHARLASHPDRAAGERSAGDWMRKVRVVSNSQPLLPPEVPAPVLDAVSRALWHDEWLDVTYRNAAGRSIEGRVMPLGLAQQGERLYLVCRFEGHDDVRMLAVHRIRSAGGCGFHFKRPADFDLEAYESDGHFAFGDGTRVELEFLVAKAAGLHLLESRLCEDQRATDEGACWRISARVPATQQLTWWLRGFGDDVTVLAPSALARAVHPHRTGVAA